MATASELNSLADAPGTSREYETIYVLRPGITNEGVAEINERVRNIVENMDGKVVKVDNWGKRRLAYEIEKERKGIYLYWQYLANRGVVAEIERNLRMLDSVIRFMTIKIDQDVDPEVRPIEVDETTYERAANTAADEEDLYLSRVASGEDEDEDDYGDHDERRAKSESSAEGAESAEAAKSAEGAESAEGAKSAEGAESAEATKSTEAAEGAKSAEGAESAEGTGDTDEDKE